MFSLLDNHNKIHSCSLARVDALRGYDRLYIRLVCADAKGWETGGSPLFRARSQGFLDLGH
jgi:hypothetical protein